ncbi:MAG: hypothetical protein ACLTQI_02645 [Slackia sp.]
MGLAEGRLSANEGTPAIPEKEVMAALGICDDDVYREALRRKLWLWHVEAQQRAASALSEAALLEIRGLTCA